MAELTHCSFDVPDKDDETRTFTFDTMAQGEDYRVTISFDGSGPIRATLNKNNERDVQVMDNGARVRPSGTLSLSYNNTSPTVLIVFTGTLHTAHSVSMTNVCIGAID